MHYDLADNEHGLTMRDYFAAKAMAAIISHPDTDTDKPPSLFAIRAYRMADAMMEAREK
jgi:hypothetical protein